MPIYEYNCEHCSYKFDKLVMSHNTDVKCPLCQGGVKKLMSTFSVGIVAHNELIKFVAAVFAVIFKNWHCVPPYLRELVSNSLKER